ALGDWEKSSQSVSTRNVWWIICGISLGFALLSKYTAAAFLLSALIYLSLQPNKRHVWQKPGVYLALFFALLIWSPNLIWNATHGFASINAVKDNADLNGQLFHPLKFLSFIVSQFAVFGPILFAVLF